MFNLIYFVVNPQEATESPGSSEELEAGVEPLKQVKVDTKTRVARQHAELCTLPPPGLNCLLYRLFVSLCYVFRIRNLLTLH